MQQNDSKFQLGRFIIHTTVDQSTIWTNKVKISIFIKMRSELQMNIQGNLLICFFFFFCPWRVCESNQLEKGVAGGDECSQS